MVNFFMLFYRLLFLAIMGFIFVYGSQFGVIKSLGLNKLTLFNIIVAYPLLYLGLIFILYLALYVCRMLASRINN